MGKTQYSVMIYKLGKTIMKYVALQKYGQMCELKYNCSIGQQPIHWVKLSSL